MNRNDYSRIRAELLRALRGKRSQSAFSRKLGYSFNIVNRWESGTTQLDWDDFERICESLKIDLPGALARLLGVRSAYGSPGLVRRLLGDLRITAAAKATGRSRFVISRWLSGTTSPPLEEVLFLFDTMQFILVEFLAEIVDLEKIPAVRAERELRELQKRVLYDHPYVGAVLRVLETPEFAEVRAADYRGQLAERVGFDRAREPEILEVLRRANVIEIREGCYRVKSEALDLRGDFEGGRRIREYWARRTLSVLESLRHPQERTLHGYSVFNVSSEGEQRIREAYFEFYSKVRSLVQADRAPPDRVKVLNIQISDLAEI